MNNYEVMKFWLRYYFHKIDKFEDQFKISVDAGLLTSGFFDSRGEKVIKGGAERYIINLAELLKNRFGLDLTVFQKSSSFMPWTNNFQGIDVVGLPVRGKQKYLNYFFHKFVDCRKLTIYNTLDLAGPLCNSNSLGISHGVYWDGPHKSSASKMRMIQKFFTGLTNVNKLISVDTNTLNFFRAYSEDENINQKMRYIPNFVDIDIFKPTQGREDGGKLIITYPRRLYEARGYDLFVDLIHTLAPKNSKVKFLLVGELDSEKIKNSVDTLIQQYPDQVEHRLVDFEKMQEIYQMTDIAIVPTKYSEGTSLSLLEAMACRCCVVTTNVGGLPNIVLDGFNGILCEPTSKSVTSSVENLIINSEKRNKLAENGLNSVRMAFNKEIWVEKWSDSIHDVL